MPNLSHPETAMCPRVRTDREGGFAMIVVMSVSTIALALALLTMEVGVRLNESTTRDRRWHSALVVAESGIQDALLRYGAAAAFPNPPPAVVSASGQAAGGNYTATMEWCTAPGTPAGCKAKGWLIANSTGSVPLAGGRSIARRVRVSYGPDPAFRYALFSFGDLDVKNNTVVKGDVFANGNITIGTNARVEGDVISSRGWVNILNDSRIVRDGATQRGGNVYSGGNNSTGNFGIQLANNVTVDADVHARRDCPAPAPGLPTATEKIIGGGTVGGSAFAPGAITVSMPVARKFQVCKQRPAESALPPLQPWTSSTVRSQRELLADYYCGQGNAPVNPGPDGECPNGFPFREFASVAGAQGFATKVLDGTPPPGVYYINDPTDATINMRGQMITSTFAATGNPDTDKRNDFVLRTTNKLSWGNGTEFYTGPGTALIEILSDNPSGAPPSGCPDPPAINVENALQVTSTTATSTDPNIPKQPAVLWYSKGCIDTKNNGVLPGAAYGNPLKVKNNLVVTYDERILRSIGAGNFWFRQATWNELRL